jgi:hypothetical protein
MPIDAAHELLVSRWGRRLLRSRLARPSGRIVGRHGERRGLSPAGLTTAGCFQPPAGAKPERPSHRKGCKRSRNGQRQPAPTRARSERGLAGSGASSAAWRRISRPVGVIRRRRPQQDEGGERVTRLRLLQRPLKGRYIDWLAVEGCRDQFVGSISGHI